MLSVKPWRPLAVLIFFAALLFCICLGGVTSDLLRRLHVNGFREADDFGHILFGTLAFQGSACGLIVFFWRHHQIGWRDGFGFNGPELKRALRLALLVFIGALPAVWLVQAASVFTLTALGHPPDDQMAVQLIDNAKSWWARSYFAVFAVVLAPVTEEFIFRGLLYPFIKQFGWPRLAFGGVSVLFALIHFDVATFLPLLLLALVLVWLYEKTDNLLAPITVHALFNASNLAMLVLKHFYPDPKL